MDDFFLDFRHTNDSRNEKTGGNGSNRHHHGVRQEVEEIQELHAKNGDGGKRSVAKAGERSERNHDNADQNGRFFTAPAELILKGGNGTFCQCDGAGQCGKQHQKEKQNTDHSAEAHIGEYLRDGDKHQGRSCLQGIRISAGEGKDGRNDHETCHDCNCGVENFDVPGGILNRGLLFHVGTEGDQNTHRDREGVEHLSHGGNNGHP